jgi:hypothetical protein
LFPDFSIQARMPFISVVCACVFSVIVIVPGC